MAMPPQLARGLRLRRQSGRTEQRPLVECLRHINIHDLQIPRDYKTYTAPHISLRFPELLGIKVSFQAIEFRHTNGHIQTFRLKHIRTGLGYSPRHTFICHCQRAVIRLYIHRGRLGCRRCIGATYASRVCSQKQRPALQAHRIQAFLQFKPAIGRKARERLQAQLRLLATKPQTDLLQLARVDVA